MSEESKTERAARLNRERVQRHRDKQRDDGMIKVEVWVKPEHKARVINFVARLK